MGSRTSIKKLNDQEFRNIIPSWDRRYLKSDVVNGIRLVQISVEQNFGFKTRKRIKEPLFKWIDAKISSAWEENSKLFEASLNEAFKIMKEFGSDASIICCRFFELIFVELRRMTQRQHAGAGCDCGFRHDMVEKIIIERRRKSKLTECSMLIATSFVLHLHRHGKRCKECGKVVAIDKYSHTYFCDSSCGTTYNNRQRKIKSISKSQ